MKGVERRRYLEWLGKEYRRGGKEKKGEILTQVSERLGVCRRQARRLLAAKEVGRPKKLSRRGRPGRYQDSEFKDALKLMWRTCRYMCSRHLKAALPDWLEYVEQERGAFPESVHERLLKISAATIDRILKPYKATKGKSTTRSGGFRDQIPIQENIWNITEPGFLEADTAAHCGGSLLGEYIHSLVMVDIATTWSEARAVFGKGSTPIVRQIEDIELFLPFDIKGYDSDNGTEVLNRHILKYFREERPERNRKAVQVTRSREYKKNDNAHVEQRNDSLARKWLGYERLDFIEIQPLVDYYYKFILCPLLNHFFPSFKIQDKIRLRSRTRRVYRDPLTPYARVMMSNHVPTEYKNHLKQIHLSLNPLELSRLEQKMRKQIDLAMKALRSGNATPRLLTLPQPPKLLLLPYPLHNNLPQNNVTIGRVSDPHTLPLRKCLP